MAVTLTVAELAAALRLGDSAEETAEVTRLLAYATEAIAQHAPSASDTAMNESARRLAGYLFDQPEAGRGMAYSNALRNSGAQRMLLPYRVHRLGIADAVEAAQAAVGTVSNPVVGLAVQGDQLVVTFEDGSIDTLDLPAGMGGDGLDQTARDSADAAQADIDQHETSEHNTDAVARAAAATAQSDADAAGSTASSAAGAATTAQATADTNRTNLTDHEADDNAHHTPPTGGGGGGTDESMPSPLATAAEGAATGKLQTALCWPMV